MTQAQDQYDFWRRRLAGEELPISDGDVEAGFYRLKNRDGSFSPVAYWWREDGALRCRIANKDVSEDVARERWMWASKEPITHALYQAIVGGAEWPDQHEAVSKLSNNPPADDSAEGLQAAIEDLAREAAILIEKGAANTQAESDRAADLANKLADLHGKGDRARIAEKQPHLDACRDVDGKWKAIITPAEIYKRVKAVVIEPFLRKQREERERAATEARQQAEEAARSGNAAALEAAERKVEQIVSTKVTSGSRGRSVGLRSVTRVVITDRVALLAYFADRQEVTDLLQGLAEKAVKAGIVPAGVEVKKDSQAA